MADYGDEHARRAREEGGRRRAAVPPHQLTETNEPQVLLGRRVRVDEEDRPEMKVGRRPMVASMLDEQQAQLYKLSELISHLGEVIAPAMRPDNPNGEGGLDGDASPEMSEVSRSIDANTDIVRAMQRRVQDYLDRLEV